MSPTELALHNATIEILADRAARYQLCFKAAVTQLCDHQERLRALERQNIALREELRRYTAAVVASAIGA